jgi:hypothetical protein
MEVLFRPTTRFRDSHRNRGADHLLEEIELLQALAPQDVLATIITWDNYCLFVGVNKIVWMAPNVYVCSHFMHNMDDPNVLALGGIGAGTRLLVHVTRGTASSAATATCDFAVRLLATCELRNIYIRGPNTMGTLPISGAGLSHIFEETRDNLRKLSLSHMILNEDQCLALATMSRLDVVLAIRYCTLADDAAGAFVECLQSDRGPVELINCEIDSQVLASGLAGNSRVTRLAPYFDEMAVLFAALANNSGLLELDLDRCTMSEEDWKILCESLRTHPTLTGLDLRNTSPRSPAGAPIRLSDEQKAHRTRSLAEMVQRNSILHTICYNEIDQQIYRESILPYLETNLYRSRVTAVRKTSERPFREKVLGRALYCVTSHPNLVWMFLSQNVDAFVRSEEEEEINREMPAAVAAAVVTALPGSKRKRLK